MLDLRSLIRDLVGFTLYVVSWYILTIIPLLLTGGALQVSEGLKKYYGYGVSFLDGVGFVEAAVFGINFTEAMLAGLIFRWLARGVVEGNRIKTIFVALCAFAVGTLSLYVHVVPLGVFFLVIGLVICIVANPTAKRDRT